MKQTLALLAAISLSGISRSATLTSAEVTVTVNQVALVNSGQKRAASVGDTLSGQSELETGAKSRAELVFNDQTIARLGANSVFSFSKGTRDMELNGGVILLQVPKGAGGARVETASVTAAVTGTTIAVEYSPPSDGFPGKIKIFVLEGTLRAFLKAVPGESMLLEAGQMIELEPDANRLPEARVFDIGRLVETAGLLSDQFGELPSLPIILQNIELQDAEKAGGRLLISNFTLHNQLPAGMAQFRNQNQDIALRILQNDAPKPPPPPPPKAPKPPPPPPPTPPPPPKSNPSPRPPTYYPPNGV